MLLIESMAGAARRPGFEPEPQLPRMLLASTFLSGHNGNQSVTEDLAGRFRIAAKALICVSAYRSGWLRASHMLYTALVRRAHYDLAIVDLFSGRAFLWGEALCYVLSALGCPPVVVLHGGSLPDFARRRPKRVEACLKRAAAVVAPSKYLLEQMRPYRPDIRLVPNPLSLSRYPFRLRKRPFPRLIWLRAFHQIYNPLLAVAAIRLLARDFPEVRLTMVGPDKKDGTLQALTRRIEECGVERHICLSDAIPRAEVPAQLSEGDIFLNTTNVDNAPVSIVEAAALGLCIVSTNVDGIPYLLEHETDALLVAPNDPEAMAHAVRRILEDPGLAEKLSLNARRKAEQFDWSEVFPKWKDLLSSVAGGARA